MRPTVHSTPVQAQRALHAMCAAAMRARVVVQGAPRVLPPRQPAAES